MSTFSALTYTPIGYHLHWDYKQRRPFFRFANNLKRPRGFNPRGLFCISREVTLEKLITAKAAADVLGITPRALLAKVSRKEIPAIKLGYLWRFSESELKLFVQACERITVVAALENIALPRRRAAEMSDDAA